MPRRKVSSSPFKRRVRRRGSRYGARIGRAVSKYVPKAMRNEVVKLGRNVFSDTIGTGVLKSRASAGRQMKAWNSAAHEHAKGRGGRRYSNRSYFAGYSLRPFKNKFDTHEGPYIKRGYISKIKDGGVHFREVDSNPAAVHGLIIGHNCMPAMETFRAVLGAICRHVLIKWGFDLRSWSQKVNHPVHTILEGSIEMNIFFKTAPDGAVQHGLGSSSVNNSYIDWLDACCDEFMSKAGTGVGAENYFEVVRLVFQVTGSIQGSTTAHQQMTAQSYLAEECTIVVNGNSNLQVQNRTGAGADGQVEADYIANNPLRGKHYLAYGSIQPPAVAETDPGPGPLKYNVETGILANDSSQWGVEPYLEEMKKPFPSMLFKGLVGERTTSLGPGAIRRSNVKHSVRKTLKQWVVAMLPYLRTANSQQASADSATRTGVGKSHIFYWAKLLNTGDTGREGKMILGWQVDNTVSSMFYPKHSLRCAPRNLVLQAAT